MGLLLVLGSMACSGPPAQIPAAMATGPCALADAHSAPGHWALVQGGISMCSKMFSLFENDVPSGHCCRLAPHHNTSAPHHNISAPHHNSSAPHHNSPAPRHNSSAPHHNISAPHHNIPARHPNSSVPHHNMSGPLDKEKEWKTKQS